jgi:beta-glucuronidase
MCISRRCAAHCAENAAVRALVAALLVLACAAVLAPAAHAADTPSARTLYADGPQGRYLLDGPWLFRQDAFGVGLHDHWERQSTRAGWTPTTVPNAWNAADDSQASMRGSVGWYRKEFRLPTRAGGLAWVLRFESVNYRATVWLNGRLIGRHAGAYLPFELTLRALKRRGTNRLVVRVDSVRTSSDFPPAGTSLLGIPTGGWWNDSGILREVYLRRVDQVDWADGTVVVRPQLRCPTCDARITVQAPMRNATAKPVRTTVTGDFGGHAVRLGTATIPPRETVVLSGAVTLRHPRLWAIDSPYLYRVRLQASVEGRTVARYALHSGVRSITTTADGRLRLNGRALNVRGVGFHEDTKELGFAIDDAARRRLVAETRALGGTMMRTHYPPHPYLEELADRAGILLWSEIPVYSVASGELLKASVRRAALGELQTNIETNQNHASIALWSVANELDSNAGRGQTLYLAEAAKLAHTLDPTRPVGYALAGLVSQPCQAAYAPLDVIGINEYFGWYTGPGGEIFDRLQLSSYLDAQHACYPGKALMITEFGAEANRDGPVEEKGTWAFQQDFVNYHLAVYATKPWLNGALYWALNEFRVRPGWEGGNPRPDGVVHQKGLLQWGTWARKPAWADVRRWYAQTAQIAPPAAAPSGRR